MAVIPNIERAIRISAHFRLTWGTAEFKVQKALPTDGFPAGYPFVSVHPKFLCGRRCLLLLETRPPCAPPNSGRVVSRLQGCVPTETERTYQPRKRRRQSFSRNSHLIALPVTLTGSAMPRFTSRLEVSSRLRWVGPPRPKRHGSNAPHVPRFLCRLVESLRTTSQPAAPSSHAAILQSPLRHCRWRHGG